MSQAAVIEQTHPEEEFVAFRVADQEYCVNIMSVREIRGWSPSTVLPDAPEFVCGVINLRGSVLPIVDLARRLGLPATTPNDRHVIIITQIENQVVGLLVDAVSDILSVLDENIQPTPEIASEAAQSFIRGVIAVEERMISLIDLNTILPSQVEKD